MPKDVPRICNRCHQPTIGKCSTCRRSPAEPKREHSAARGYGYDWQQFRARYIASRVKVGHYYCDDCKKPFNRQRGTPELHHIEKIQDNPARRLDASNLLMLCQVCHATRTARGE